MSGDDQALTVSLENFEGPLDLLLYLIRREEISIYDIPIARITAQYLDYLADLAAVDVDRAAAFLVMAATLLGIKARLLLPQGPPDAVAAETDAAEAEADPRAGLVRQLEEYEQIQAAALDLAARETEAKRFFTRGWEIEAAGGPPPLVGVSLADLVAAFAGVLQAEWSWREVPREQIPLREKMREIARLLARHPEGLPFSQLFPHTGVRRELVVTFLALLELIRAGRASAHQAQPFGEIWLRKEPGR